MALLCEHRAHLYAELIRQCFLIVQYHKTLDITVLLVTQRWVPRDDELVLKMMTMLTAIITVTYFITVTSLVPDRKTLWARKPSAPLDATKSSAATVTAVESMLYIPCSQTFFTYITASYYRHYLIIIA
jgi:hypothetical protein